MKCQFCSNPATVHLTDIVNRQKNELHLCQACAEKKQLLKQQELNLPAILQTLIGQHVGPQTDELARLTCPAAASSTWSSGSQGRLGCPHDYEVFAIGLEPLLLPDSTAPARHVGKAPRQQGRRPIAWPNWSSCAGNLQPAVEAEAYEEAARLRDLLRQKEATDESG